ncbi:MAG: hypothetical protein KJ659_11655 [Actinobacteria bacterium]|nr:hypothetical protein [Actinomycetota bacterium]MBU1608977.1 hypothetical protein [Actinomycetota bacterium]MBU2316874.1 hypothetical protein [Actinomycetota bacterium]MBU2386126.1 hypothetical protein [Actinomycetota bacterium]
MPTAWEPIHFVRGAAEAEEPMGSKEKWWVDLPMFGERQWLLKLARLDELDGTVSGEDWAEWTVHQLAEQLGIPSATVRPALLEDRRAIVSRSVLRDRLEYLDHGNSVLSARFADYDQSIHGENRGYTLVAVQDALVEVRPPADIEWPGGFTAFDVWAGYLLMDAWVAGRDRHHENWAVILRGDERRLAPSFDHGNALGFQERDERRVRMLEDERHLERWVERGTSHHFAGKPKLTELAWSALRLASPSARRFWIGRLDAISQDALHSILSKVPNAIMSEVTHTFVIRLLATNRRRLLDGYSGT